MKQPPRTPPPPPRPEPSSPAHTAKDPRSNRYTARQRLEAVEAAVSGERFCDIAARIGCHPVMVGQWVKRAETRGEIEKVNRKRKKGTKHEAALLGVLRAASRPLHTKQVAEQANLTRDTVQQALKVLQREGKVEFAGFLRGHNFWVPTL